jgi:hypothetical protein
MRELGYTYPAANVPTPVNYIGSIWLSAGYEQQYPRILRYFMNTLF